MPFGKKQQNDQKMGGWVGENKIKKRCHNPEKVFSCIFHH
jgi:hypothetical protein